MPSQWLAVVKDARDANTVKSEISIAEESASDVHPKAPTDRQPDAWGYFRDVSSYFAAGSVGATSLKITVTDNVVAATATITLEDFEEGDTITVGGVVFEGGVDFAIGATDTITAANFVAALNDSEEPDVHCLVTSSSSGAVITLTALVPGPMGNFLPIATEGGAVISGYTPPATSPLLTAATYAALAKSAISNTGNTVLAGDLGLSPGTSVTGFPPGIVTGTQHVTDAAAAQAQLDATAAAVAFQATGPGTDISSTDLGGYTATPGTYSASSAGTWVAGPLTLDGAGTYIFLFGTSLTLPANASIVLTNGATANDVYFVTGTAFTFGADNLTYGTVLAGSAITTASNTIHVGRLLVYGASGTAITFPSAAVVTVPSADSEPTVGATLTGGTSDDCGSVAEGII